jgi:hypothetical protein
MESPGASSAPQRSIGNSFSIGFEKGVEPLLRLKASLSSIIEPANPQPSPDPHQLQLFEDGDPDSRQACDTEPGGMTTLLRVSHEPIDRNRQLLALAFFLQACSMGEQARPSDRKVAEAILQEGSAYAAALAAADRPDEVRSLRGHFSQRARILANLVEKMISEPHFFSFLEVMLPLILNDLQRRSYPR